MLFELSMLAGTPVPSDPAAATVVGSVNATVGHPVDLEVKITGGKADQDINFFWSLASGSGTFDVNPTPVKLDPSGNGTVSVKFTLDARGNAKVEAEMDVYTYAHKPVTYNVTDATVAAGTGTGTGTGTSGTTVGPRVRTPSDTGTIDISGIPRDSKVHLDIEPAGSCTPAPTSTWKQGWLWQMITAILMMVALILLGSGLLYGVCQFTPIAGCGGAPAVTGTLAPTTAVSAPPVVTAEICNNGVDDDGDGLVDMLDTADCKAPTGTTTAPPVPTPPTAATTPPPAVRPPVTTTAPTPALPAQPGTAPIVVNCCGCPGSASGAPCKSQISD